LLIKRKNLWILHQENPEKLLLQGAVCLSDHTVWQTLPTNFASITVGGKFTRP
jgi:hypothetical protein